MSGNAVRVAVRTRPTAFFDQDQIFIDSAAAAVDIRHKASYDVVNNRQEAWHFKFNDVLHNRTQDEVYDTLARDIVTDACSGRSGAVMAYGQTGSGKSFTMIGDPTSYKNRGVAPRAVAQVFSHIASKPECDYSVSVSYLEIYNEKFRDLLVAAGATLGHAPGSADGMAGATAGVLTKTLAHGVQAASNSGIEFTIVEDPVHGTVVRGLTLVPVSNEEEALQCLFAAELARTTAEHSLNRSSNRSHCIFTLHIQQRSRLGGGREKILSSKLHCVDLAGSERIKKTMSGGPAADEAELALQRESMAINKSLAYLEQCVVALTSRGRTHVPYRTSKLTNVLKDALGGNCNTLLVACVWGEARHLEETISTLRLAQRMMGVQNEVAEAVAFDTDALIKKLQREAAQLKQELQMHDALADRTGITYSEYTPEQQAALHAKLRAFIAATTEEGETAALQLESVQQMREILRQVKVMLRSTAVETEERLRAQYILTPKDGSVPLGASADFSSSGGFAASSAGSRPASAAATRDAAALGSGVGHLDASLSGLGLGLAPSGSRPAAVQLPASISARSGALSPRGTDGFAVHAGSPGGRHGGGGGGGGAGKGVAAPADVNAAWHTFRTSPALAGEAATKMTALRGAQADKRSAVAAAARDVNTAKQQIDALTKLLADIKSGARRPPSASAAAAASSSKPSSAKGKPSSAVPPASGTPGAPAAVPASGGAGDTLDEEEFRVAKELSDAKRAYKAAHARFAAAKEALAAVTNDANAVMAEMLRDFEVWYSSSTGRLPPVPLSQALSPARSASPIRGGAGGAGGSSLGFSRGGGFGATAAFDWQAENGGGDDALDDGEAFEKMQHDRVVSAEPDSSAYFMATKKLRETVGGPARRR